MTTIFSYEKRLNISFYSALISLFEKRRVDKSIKTTVIKGDCLVEGNKYTTIPDSVKEIGYGAFRYCKGLKSIVIPNSVTKIGTYAFYRCSDLRSIIIPESVVEIGHYAFYGCSALKHIVVADNNNVYDSRNNCNAIIETKTNTLVLGCNYSVIPETVDLIELLAFTKPNGLARSIISISDKSKRTSLLHNYLERLNYEIRLEENCALYGCAEDSVDDPIYDPLGFYLTEKEWLEWLERLV